jgi:hypothetical protein
MKCEAAESHVLIPLKRVQEIVARTTGVSRRILRRILIEGSRCEEEGTPGKHHSVPKRITNPDDFDIL